MRRVVYVAMLAMGQMQLPSRLECCIPMRVAPLVVAQGGFEFSRMEA